MSPILSFFLNSVLFGVGLAVDAFLISLSNGLNAPETKRRKMLAMAVVFALFQLIAPMVGWICINTIAKKFELFEECLSWLSLAVLSYIGVKMIVDGACRKKTVEEKPKVGLFALLLQAGITSIDALSVGFAIADYEWRTALAGSAIIALITFLSFIGGFCIGKKFGIKLANKASVLGGIIFIFIGVEVFVNSLI